MRRKLCKHNSHCCPRSEIYTQTAETSTVHFSKEGRLDKKGTRWAFWLLPFCFLLAILLIVCILFGIRLRRSICLLLLRCTTFACCWRIGVSVSHLARRLLRYCRRRNRCFAARPRGSGSRVLIAVVLKDWQLAFPRKPLHLPTAFRRNISASRDKVNVEPSKYCMSSNRAIVLHRRRCIGLKSA